jgi:hypothetical protein
VCWEFVEADLQVRPGRPTGLSRRRLARPLRNTSEFRFRRVVGITASLLTAAPASALACPVCALVGPSDNTWAYQAMSAMLTLLPLAMVGAIVWWLARLAARADTEHPPETQHVVDRAPVSVAETCAAVAQVE